MATQKAFTHLALFNGFPSTYGYLSQRSAFASNALLGPYDIKEAAEIFWRLKNVDFTVSSQSHYENSDKIRHSKKFFGAMAQTSADSYDIDTRLELGEGFSVDPRKRMYTGIRVYETFATIYGDITETFFEMNGLIVDDVKYTLADENLFTQKMYYFTYTFSSADAFNGYHLRFANYSEDASGFTLKTVPFLGRELSIMVIPSAPAERLVWSVDISAAGEFYEDGDFI